MAVNGGVQPKRSEETEDFGQEVDGLENAEKHTHKKEKKKSASESRSFFFFLE